MQHDQHEEWIMRHAWGATAMEQDDSIDQSSDEKEQVTAGEGEPILEEVEPLDETASSPPTQRIVEGTLVESTLLAPAPPSNPQGEEDGQHSLRALRHWFGQGLLTVLVALLTVLALTPTQPPVMRLFVSLMPAAGVTATLTLVTDQVDLHRAYTLLAVPAGVVSPTTSHHQPSPQTQIEARLLAAPALTQQVMAPTTGKGHQPDTQAHGWVTFYNQAPTAQVSGADGVQVVTDQAVTVSAAHLPAQGQVTLAAHAVQAGPGGNIGANDLNGLCCFAGIAMQNAQAFVGGANARDFPAVGARDVSGAATPAVGGEATQVIVKVLVTCRAEVYHADHVQARVTTLLNQEAMTHLGRAYVLQGEVTSIVSTITTVDARQGVVSLQVQTEGTWAYQLSAAQLHALTTLVAGTPLQQTRAILLHTQGIHQVTVTSIDWWDDASQQTLPPDPNRIQVVVISWAGM